MAVALSWICSLLRAAGERSAAFPTKISRFVPHNEMIARSADKDAAVFFAGRGRRYVAIIPIEALAVEKSNRLGKGSTRVGSVISLMIRPICARR